MSDDRATIALESLSPPIRKVGEAVVKAGIDVVVVPHRDLYPPGEDEKPLSEFSWWPFGVEKGKRWALYRWVASGEDKGYFVMSGFRTKNDAWKWIKGNNHLFDALGDLNSVDVWKIW